MWFIGVEVEQETSVPTPKKDPGSAPVLRHLLLVTFCGEAVFKVMDQKTPR